MKIYSSILVGPGAEGVGHFFGSPLGGEIPFMGAVRPLLRIHTADTTNLTKARSPLGSFHANRLQVRVEHPSASVMLTMVYVDLNGQCVFASRLATCEAGIPFLEPIHKDDDLSARIVVQPLGRGKLTLVTLTLEGEEAK